MIVPLLLLETMNPNQSYSKKNLLLTLINAVIYSFAIFAYSAFDTVIVGLVYSVLITVTSGVLFLSVRKKYLQYPFTTYTAATYTLGTVSAVIIRILMAPH